MKTFKYKFSKLTFWLIIAGLLLCVAAFALNLYQCIRYGIASAADPVYPIIQYTTMFVVTVALFSILLSVLIFSAYTVDDKYFKTRFGFIVSKYEVKKIERVTLDRKSNKLAVTFEDDNYIVIVVKEEWYEDFVQALLKVNPKIEYEIKSLENDKKDGLK